MPAIVLVWDLQGFTPFLDDTQVVFRYGPLFLNHVSRAVATALGGDDPSLWPRGGAPDPVPHPVHEKFLGDGALYVWTVENDREEKRVALRVCNRLWTLKANFDKVLDRISDDVPVVTRPSGIRFGVACGFVHPLENAQTGEQEFIGQPINLASRLQNYCRELGFLASARIGIPRRALRDNGYIRARATGIAGFRDEVVIVEEEEFEALDDAVRSVLFTREA